MLRKSPWRVTALLQLCSLWGLWLWVRWRYLWMPCLQRPQTVLFGEWWWRYDKAGKCLSIGRCLQHDVATRCAFELMRHSYSYHNTEMLPCSWSPREMNSTSLRRCSWRWNRRNGTNPQPSPSPSPQMWCPAVRGPVWYWLVSLPFVLLLFVHAVCLLWVI